MTATLLSYLPAALITVSNEQVVTYANAAAEQLFGTHAAALAGHPLSQFIQPYDEIEHAIRMALDQKAPVREFDVSFAGPRIAPIHVGLHVVPMEELASVMLLIDDRSLEMKLSRHKAGRDGIKSASHMASILAHEVKNPLAGIRGAAQLLGATVSEEDSALTRLICDEVDRIRSVIEEMEIFSNPAELKMQPVNIHEILDYVKNLMENSFAGTGEKTDPCRFQMNYDPSIPPVNGNRTLLIQLFLNLVGNAAQALSDTTHPTIRLATGYEPGFRFRPEGDTPSRKLPLVITVADNGPGIAAELKNHIFEPFVTNRDNGKGLGLAIAAKIVADHGGVIEADTEVSEGACFRVRLPAG